MMLKLEEIYDQHDGRLLNKWHHYLGIYERYFARYRDTDLTFLEFGIAHGGSLQMWRNYFGSAAKLTGVDVNPECKKFEEPGTQVFIGSQEDDVFLHQLKTSLPKVDILLDDGGHTMKQQMTTFNAMFDHVKEGGLYVCEDTHTSYWPGYFGGYKKQGTFIEFAKTLVDDLHGWHYKKSGKEAVSHFTKNIKAVHFYDSIVVIEKAAMQAPQNTFKGQPTLSNHFQSYGQKNPVRILPKGWKKRLFGK